MRPDVIQVPDAREIVVTTDEAAPMRARRFVERALDHPDRLDDVVLAVSELVNNLVVRSAPGTPVHVRLSQRERRIRVEVAGEDVPPFSSSTQAMPDPDELIGRGLPIVSAVTDRMGTDEARSSVWFEILR